MTVDLISTQIKEMADRWDTPTFDPAAIAEQSRARARSRRNRLAAGSSALILVTTTALIVLIKDLHDDRQPTTQRVATSPPARPTTNTGVAPAFLPPVRIQPVTRTGRTLNGQQVLAETRAGSSVTLKARLFFPRRERGRVTAAALVLCQPGTGPGVSPTTAISYYQPSRVALGPKVAATAPQERILTVTTPRQLQAGRYPVLWVENTGLLPGQQRGIRGPFTVSGQLGILLIHPHKGP
jgi:hypothetical protein